ncbi:uncharacterized protein LOC142632611 [Castanea sativa]|uniref:uncharacterized protein LOC142632611 n=1 Tax=Castanea sativa TaxID=21020 RepID=UPI003F6506C4
MRSSLRILEKFHAANEKPQPTTESITEEIKWCPPQRGSYKVNVDGAVFTKQKQVGIGVVIRDSAGDVIAALSHKISRPLGALETEAKAMEIGIQFALDVGVRDVVFEGDALSICNALRGVGEVLTFVQNVVASMSQRVKAFRKYAFSHTKRQGNIPAHLLTHHTRSVESYVAWLEECPSIIEHACAHDIVSFSHD